MVQRVKSDLCSLVRQLGYNITDNGAYQEKYPWLLLRTSKHTHTDTATTRTDNLVLIIDIYSTYKGEKEILDIVENITNHIWELKTNNPNIMYINQRDLKIIDDNTKGPLKKHGIVYYTFLLSSSIGEEDNTDDTTGN